MAGAAGITVVVAEEEATGEGEIKAGCGSSGTYKDAHF